MNVLLLSMPDYFEHMPPPFACPMEHWPRLLETWIVTTG
jgi:hypothetical protein